MNRRLFVSALFAGLALVAVSSIALADGEWVLTGSAVRTKSIGFISVNVYQVDHYVKAKPAHNRQAVIEHGGDKKLVLTMLRDVPQDKIRNAFAEALNKNGGGAVVGQMNSVFNDKGPDLAKGSHINVVYNAATKTTSISADGSGKVAIAGEDNMKSVWKIWFGNIDQSSIPEGLMSKL